MSVFTAREGREHVATAILSPQLLEPEIIQKALDYLCDTSEQCYHHEFLFEGHLLGSSPTRGSSYSLILPSPLPLRF